MRWAFSVFFAALAFASPGSYSSPTILYKTSFEPHEGFDARYTLAGQRGWTNFGSGGNGLLFDFIPEHGQQAFVGYYPPLDAEDFTSVWRPVNFSPLPAGVNIVTFSVLIDFEPSTLGGDDDFRWSIYNADGVRLFSIDFETSTQLISYLLDDGQFRSTGYTFDFDGVYSLYIWMDFARNAWSARLNDVDIVSYQPITLYNSALTFGDADAVWFIRNPTNPGNNYMLFDDYQVMTDDFPWIEPAGVSERGFIQFYVHGREGEVYSVQVTSDFVDWFSLGNFEAPEGGSFLFEDDTSGDYRYGFYQVGPPVP